MDPSIASLVSSFIGEEESHLPSLSDGTTPNAAGVVAAARGTEGTALLANTTTTTTTGEPEFMPWHSSSSSSLSFALGDSGAGRRQLRRPARQRRRTSSVTAIPSLTSLTKFKIVVFTKDRPWQLQQLLRSMKLSRFFSSLAPTTTTTAPTATSNGQNVSSLELHVLARVQPLYEQAYEQVIEETRQEIQRHLVDMEEEEEGGESETTNTNTMRLSFWREDDNDPSKSFSSLLQSILNNRNNHNNEKDKNASKEEEEEDDDDEEDAFSGTTTTAVMFLTDDCLLMEPLSHLVGVAVESLSTTALCFLSRLHAGLSWCQTMQEPSLPPRSHLQYLPHYYQYPIDTTKKKTPHRASGGYCWYYPFDLSGGVYRLSTVHEWLNSSDSNSSNNNSSSSVWGTPEGNHPNRLEVVGNRRAMSQTTSPTMVVAIPTHPLLVVLAINRVQSVYRAPLALDPTKDKEKDFVPESLLEKWHAKQHLNIDAYRSVSYNASHIGHVFLQDDDEDEDDDKEMILAKGEQDRNRKETPSLSVLMPVHTGPPRAAEHAIRSVLMQLVDESSSSSWCHSWLQIVLVDDRCVDGSIESMCQTAKGVAQEHGLSVVIKDHRCNNNDDDDYNEPEEEARTMNVCVEIYQSSTTNGVAAALNHGWSYCRAPFVARMDADDVCAPGRFAAQLGALQVNPQLRVVGTHSVLFFAETKQRPGTDPPSPQSDNNDNNNETILSASDVPYAYKKPENWDESDEEDGSIRVRTSLPPTDPGLTAWAMLFSCCLSHPSTMFRKDYDYSNKAEELRYNESVQHAEDYDLWLRLVRDNVRSVASIPRIGLWHRKRSRGANDDATERRRLQQQKESVALVAQAMTELLSESHDEEAVDHGAVRVLMGRSCETTSSSSLGGLGVLDKAATLLWSLLKAFLLRHETALTEREKQLIELDAKERLGLLATRAVQETNDRSVENMEESVAWKLWCQESPERGLEQLTLLTTFARRRRRSSSRSSIVRNAPVAVTFEQREPSWVCS